MSYLIVLLSVGIVILAHEIGHFAGARAAGIPVRVFSIGFGPRLWGVTRGVTEYRVSLIPIGGYVLPAVDDEKEFFRYSAGARMLLAAGGPLASVVFPVACFMLFNVLKHGASITGILVTPFAQTAAILYKMVITLPAVFSHGGNVSGIIGIVAEGSRFVGPEAANIVYFMAVISLNLALLNLLPVPALDGGKILLYALEKVHVKFAKLHLPLAIAGWVLILGLLLYTTWADIGRYVLGS